MYNYGNNSHSMEFYKDSLIDNIGVGDHINLHKPYTYIMLYMYLLIYIIYIYIYIYILVIYIYRILRFCILFYQNDCIT